MRIINAYNSLIIFNIYLFLSCNSLATERVNNAFIANTVNINCNEISIRNGTFAVLLLSGGQPLVLHPEGIPETKIRARETPAGSGTETSYTWVNEQRGYRYSWKITKIGNQILSFRVEFINGSLHPVYLQKFELLTTPDNDFSVSGIASGWMLSTTDVEARRWGNLDKDIPTEGELLDQGAYSLRYLTKSGDSSKYNNRAWRGFYDDFSLYKEPGKSGVTFAAVDSICDVYYDVKVNKTKMKLEITGDMSEVLVESGESRESDEVLLLFMAWDDAQVIKNKWISVVSNVKVTKKPVFGWCSWYRMGTGVTQESIYKIAAYLKKNKDNVPFDVIQIDDGWQVSKFNWIPNGKFNRGFTDLIDSIKDAAATPGLWLSPVKVDFITSETGTKCRPFPEQWYTEYRLGRPRLDCLDPTNPEVRRHIYNSIRNKYNLGFRYFKLDFSKLEYFTKQFYNPKMTRFQAQRELFRIYRQAAGNNSYILACGPSNHRFMVPFVDAVRVGTDTNANGGFGKILATDGQPANPQGLWYPIASLVNKSYENGVLANGDPDVTYVSHLEKCSPSQLQTFHSFVGIYGGAAMISDLLYEKEFDNQDNLRMMEILYPVSKEKGHPFAGGWDILGKEFGYIVKHQYGIFANVILWNPEHQGTANLTLKNVPTNELENKFHAWSFWDEKYLGIIDKNYLAKDVPFYEHQLLRLTPKTSIPTLIGSNLHISMGATEVQSICYSDSQVILELDPNAGARNGRLYFYSEKSLINAKSTNSDAFIMRQDKNIYVLVLSNRIRDKDERITINISENSLALTKNNMNGDDQEKYRNSSFTPFMERILVKMVSTKFADLLRFLYRYNKMINVLKNVLDT